MSAKRQALSLILVSAFAGVLGTFASMRAQGSPETAVLKNPAATEFVNIAGAPECLTAAVQHGDPSKGPSTMLLKGTAGCAVPWHWHTPNEQLMMVSGTGRVQMKGDKAVLLQPGGYGFAPSHHVHRFTCSGPCMAYLYSDGIFDIHYVDGAGREIPPDDALKTKNEAHVEPK